jgi:hypothetical protein
VRERRALLPRKERNDREVYAIAALRQVLEQVSHEMAAGITHDADDVKALVALAQENVADKQAQKTRPRFRGLGR